MGTVSTDNAQDNLWPWYTEANSIHYEYHHYDRKDGLEKRVPYPIEIKRVTSFCWVYTIAAPRMLMM